jgi:ketosteroid isomerase-like protein
MKNLRMLTCLAGAGWLLAAAAPAAPAQGDAAEVAALDTRFQAAVKANDADTIEAILADDHVLVTGRGRSFDKAEEVSDARQKSTVYEHQEEEPGTQKVRVSGDTAVVTALLWIKGVREGKPIDYRLWFSDVYLRTPRGWKYWFGQASIALPKA